MLAYFFVLVAVAVRFMPHPWSFTPVAAALLFFGARGSRKQIWIPFALLAVSDVVLTKLVYHFPFYWDNYVTWAWYAAILWLGTNLRDKVSPVRVIGAALASSTSFFLISNFTTWASMDMYPKTREGLMACYAAALPFYNRSVEGDLLFTCAMFATPVLIHMLSKSLASSSDREAAA